MEVTESGIGSRLDSGSYQRTCGPLFSVDQGSSAGVYQSLRRRRVLDRDAGRSTEKVTGSLSPARTDPDENGGQEVAGAPILAGFATLATLLAQGDRC